MPTKTFSDLDISNQLSAMFIAQIHIPHSTPLSIYYKRKSKYWTRDTLFILLKQIPICNAWTLCDETRWNPKLILYNYYSFHYFR